VDVCVTFGECIITSCIISFKNTDLSNLFVKGERHIRFIGDLNAKD